MKIEAQNIMLFEPKRNTRYEIEDTIMKIKIKDIKPEGIEVSEQIAPEIIGLTPKDEGYFSEPLDVHARLSRVGNTVLAKTHVEGRYNTFCSRCVVDIQQDWRSDFLLDFPVEAATETIELDDDIRQEVLLRLPPKVLCKEDCKGICPKCGVDLNIEECKCKS